MFIYHTIPLTARPTYYHNIRSALLTGLGFGMYRMADVVAKKAFGAPDWHVALIAAAPVAGSALCLLWGRLTAGRHKMPLVFATNIAGRVLLLAAGAAKTALSFTLLVSAAPFIWQAGQPAVTSIMRTNYPAEHRGRITGTLQAWSLLAASAAAFGSGLLLDANPGFYRMIFPVAGLLGILGFLRFARIRVRGEQHLEEEAHAAGRKGLAAPLRDRRFMTFMGWFFVAGSANLLTIPVLTIYMNDELKATYWQFSLAVVVIPQIVTFLVLPWCGKVLDRNNPLLLRSISHLAFGLAFFGMYVSALSGSLNMMYGAGVLYGISLGMSTIIWSIGVMYFAPKNEVATYMGVHMALTGVRGMTMPFLGAFLSRATRDIGLQWLSGPRFVFMLAGILSLVAGAMMINMVAGERRRFGYLPTMAQAETINEGESLGNSS
ncbi:MAG: MFS transporter [Planctomycetes bacterium]|nr:MFS transporter [Planctomycetota bacterium]